MNPSLEIIVLHNGTNLIDLDGSGRKSIIVQAHRENFNAHSSDITTIYMWATREDGKEQLQIVPIQPEEKEEIQLTRWGGADCLLKDFRLLRDRANHSAILITAEREFGDSFADSRTVTFEYYSLIRNKDGTSGSPRIYFKSYKKSESQTTYCDVTDAFRAEIGAIPKKR